MPKIVYNKKALTYQQQIDLLKQRGLHIGDESKARFLLEHISYYRLSAYFYPLLRGTTTDEKQQHNFKEGASFEDAFKLYCFDRELRKMVNGEIEKIEVSIRAELVYRMSHKYDKYWYTYPALFRNKEKHQEQLDAIQNMYENTQEVFALSYRSKYINPFLPSWMAMELTTFGTLSFLYKELSDFKAKTEIARKYGLSDVVFESWLHILIYMRNICAHHAKLWGRNFSITSVKAKTKPSKPFLTINGEPRNRLYFNLAILKYFINEVNPKNSLTSRLAALLEKYPQIEQYDMVFKDGKRDFPADWLAEELWQIGKV